MLSIRVVDPGMPLRRGPRVWYRGGSSAMIPGGASSGPDHVGDAARRVEVRSEGAIEREHGMDRGVIERYEAGGRTLRRAVEGLTREDLRARPGPGAWSIQQLVIHMAD